MSQKSRCRRRCDHLFWSLFPHICLVTCLVVYSIIGAFIFQALEGSDGNDTSEAEILLDKLWNASQDGGESTFKNQSRKLIAPYVNTHRWTFLSSLFFCCTVFTTVGYGHLTPVTVYGRVACMVYSAIGIPIMLLLLADLGDILASFLSKTYKRLQHIWERRSERRSKGHQRFFSLRGRPQKSSTESTLDSRVAIREPLNLTQVLKSQVTVKKRYMQMSNIDIFELLIIKHNQNLLPMKNCFKKCHSCPELDTTPSTESAFSNFDKLGEELDQLNVPFLLIICIMVAYILLGAFILLLWEKDWDTLQAFYFCFITLTTIGFGDVFPDHPNYFLLLSAYTVIGMAIMCMSFKLVQNRMVCLYKKCIICISGGNAQMTQTKG